MGLRDLISHWPKYLAAALGMMLGVLGAVAISVTSSVATEMLIAQQEQLNGREASYSNVLAVSKTDLDSVTGSPRIVDFYQDLLDRIGPQDASVTLQSQTSMLVRTIEEKADNLKGKGLSVTWVLGDINDLQRLPILSGSMPAVGTYPPQLAINEAGARALGLTPTTKFYLSTAPSGPSTAFTMSAIVADGQQNPMAYGNYEAAIALFPSVLVDSLTMVRMRAAPDDLSSVNSLIIDSALYRGLTLEAKTVRVDSVESVRDQVGFFSMVFGTCVGLVLLISALATASVGIASVRERSRELVVRRAVGARRRDIFVQVMSASLGIGTLVAVISVVAAIVGVYWVVPLQIPAASSIIPPTFPWLACVIGVGSSYLTSAVGSLLPAVKATRLPVALALRE